MSHLTTICPFRLNESYGSLFSLEHAFSVNDNQFYSTSREAVEDATYCEKLRNLLHSSRTTRDDLMIWYMKQPLVELNVTISLITAKIKLIEYKLSLCEGLDLHQACSLSLVDFCNILSDMTVLNVKSTERKTMHMISNQAGVPVWLSHYRNQICHVPSESPCISILVPLVQKALTYMKDSFWSKMLKHESFDIIKCKNVVAHIFKFTDFTSINQYTNIKRIENSSKTDINSIKILRSCSLLRKLLRQHPNLVVEVIVNHLVKVSPKDKTKNSALLLEQVILTRCFELFIIKLLNYSERCSDKETLMWLYLIIMLITTKRKEDIRKKLKKMKLWVSVNMVKLIEVPSIKCCQIAYQLMRLDSPIVKKLLVRLRYKLLPILGKKRIQLLVQLSEVVKMQ